MGDASGGLTPGHGTRAFLLIIKLLGANEFGLNSSFGLAVLLASSLDLCRSSLRRCRSSLILRRSSLLEVRRSAFEVPSCCVWVSVSRHPVFATTADTVVIDVAVDDVGVDVGVIVIDVAAVCSILVFCICFDGRQGLTRLSPP